MYAIFPYPPVTFNVSINTDYDEHHFAGTKRHGKHGKQDGQGTLKGSRRQMSSDFLAMGKGHGADRMRSEQLRTNSLPMAAVAGAEAAPEQDGGIDMAAAQALEAWMLDLPDNDETDDDDETGSEGEDSEGENSEGDSVDSDGDSVDSEVGEGEGKAGAGDAAAAGQDGAMDVAAADPDPVAVTLARKGAEPIRFSALHRKTVQEENRNDLTVVFGKALIDLLDQG